MTYAQRPMGDYATHGYAGDPGWLSSIFKFAKKKILPGVVKFLGGPIGTAVVTAAAVAGSVKGPKPPMLPPPGSIGGAVSFPGGTTVSMAGVLPAPGMAAGQQPAGYHLDKRTRTRWVRNRRMNIANPRALRKAIRRVQGFEKLAKRTVKITSHVRRRRS